MHPIPAHSPVTSQRSSLSQFGVYHSHVALILFSLYTYASLNDIKDYPVKLKISSLYQNAIKELKSHLSAEMINLR